MTARAIIKPAAKANGQSSGAKRALTAELPSVALCGLQRSEAFVDSMRAGHFLQLAQLDRIRIDSRSRAGEAGLARKHPIECRSGTLDLSLCRVAWRVRPGRARSGRARSDKVLQRRFHLPLLRQQRRDVALELAAAPHRILERSLQHGNLVVDVDLLGDASAGESFVALGDRNVDLFAQRLLLGV